MTAIKPKVLYISYDGMTDPLGQSQVLPYLKILSAEGFQISILSSEKPDKFLANKDNIQAICDEANINWHPIQYTKSPPVISTIKDVKALTKTAIKLHQQHNYKIVHCRSYIASLAGLELKKKYPVKYVFDMRGFWADERIDGNLWNPKNPIYKRIYNYFKRKEKDFLKSADAIVSLTHSAKEEMLTWNLNIPESKISVIPCCADFDHFDYRSVSPETTKALREKLRITDSELVLGYLGSIGTWYMLEEMLLFFKKSLKLYPSAKFVFITTDAPEFIQNKARSLGLKEDQIEITSARRAEVPAYISTFDLSIFFIKPFYSKMSSSPTKLAEIMGMGKPIICNTNVGDINTIFSNKTIGEAINVYAPTEWDNAINNIPTLLKSSKESIRSTGIQLFNLNNGAQEYLSIYSKILKD